MTRTKQVMKQELLNTCESKGFRPGSLFIPKGCHWLLKIPTSSGGEEIQPDELTDKSKAKTRTLVGSEDVMMLVDVHVVNNHGAWDFWFEFLAENETFYVWMYDILGKIERHFTVKTNEV